MPRPLVIGNGKLLITLDQHGTMRDLYFPMVGQVNHVGGYHCRMGIWVAGKFSWMRDPDWDIHLAYMEDSLVTEINAVNHQLGVMLMIHDAVHHLENIYFRSVKIINLSSSAKDVRLYFNQDLTIDETEVGDTAAYYPINQTLFHYKKNNYFMFNGQVDGKGFEQFTTGVKRFHSAEGTWRDAEDGYLMGNPIAQGSVDSTIGFQTVLPPSSEKTVYYWMGVGHNLEEVKQLDRYVKVSPIDKFLERINMYWQRWANKENNHYFDLPETVIKLFKQSLLIIRTQVDRNGAITAANDTDILQFNRDHYSYVWPRDGALVAYSMSMAGYRDMILPFYQFCEKSISQEGYLHHKYNPDGTIGSSWHSYIAAGKQQLPIQEDETALVLFALWKDYEIHRDVEFVQSLYHGLIRKAAKFLYTYVLPELKLPKPSYDLWEERYGIWTFTASAVYGGLIAAANFAELFGEKERNQRYMQAANTIKSGILSQLWDSKLGRFVRGIYQNKTGLWEKDTTLESSIIGIFFFGVLPAEDERVKSTLYALKKGLTVNTSVGGIARYYNDYYFQKSRDVAHIPGNPWIICTLWMAQYEIEIAKNLDDLQKPKQTLEWVNRHAMESNVLPEQLNPLDGSTISVAPLTWSHSTYVLTVMQYIKKYEEILRI